MLRPTLAFVSRHFEAFFYLYMWSQASILGVLVGKPLLGAVGLFTVAPFLLAYALRARLADQKAR